MLKMRFTFILTSINSSTGCDFMKNGVFKIERVWYIHRRMFLSRIWLCVHIEWVSLRREG